MCVDILLVFLVVEVWTQSKKVSQTYVTHFGKYGWNWNSSFSDFNAKIPNCYFLKHPFIYIYFVLWVLYNWYKFHTFPCAKVKGKEKKLRTFLFALLSFRRFREKCLFIIFYMMEYLTFFFFLWRWCILFSFYEIVKSKETILLLLFVL